MFLGFFLVFVGILMLLNKLGMLRGGFWDYVWPAALVAVGLALVLGKRKKP